MGANRPCCPLSCHYGPEDTRERGDGGQSGYSSYSVFTA